MVEVIREALSSELPGRILHLKLEDEILTQVTKDEKSIIHLLKKRIIDPNDSPYQCVLKGADGPRESNSLIIRYQQFKKMGLWAGDPALRNGRLTARGIKVLRKWSMSYNKTM